METPWSYLWQYPFLQSTHQQTNRTPLSTSTPNVEICSILTQNNKQSLTNILSQAILPKPFYNAAIWGHKAKLKANLQKISTLINSAARIATNLPRTTPLQIIYQLTIIPSTKILLEKEIVLRLNTLLMQPHKKTHNLLRLHTPLASFSNSLIKSYRIFSLQK